MVNLAIGDIKVTCENKKKCEYLVTPDHHAAPHISLHTCLAGIIPKQYPPASLGLRSEFCDDNFDQCGHISAQSNLKIKKWIVKF